MVKFLKVDVTSKSKNKLITANNTTSHKNSKVKKVVNTRNSLLYAVLYQHATSSIKNYFSMLKSRLQKLDGLTHLKLKKKYSNIIKGAYERPKKYVFKKNQEKLFTNFHIKWVFE